MRREQSLVRRDDGFALGQCGEDDRLGEAGTADEFDDDVDLGIVDDFLPVGSQQRRWDFTAPRFAERLDGDLAESDPYAESRGQQVAVPRPRMKNAAADRAASNHSEIYLLHGAHSLPRSQAADNAILNPINYCAAWNTCSNKFVSSTFPNGPETWRCLLNPRFSP